MASRDTCIKVQDHGTALDEKKIRVSCNHCGKVVSGFSRLKYHLGGVRGDVAPCLQVPANVKEAFSNELLEKRRGSLSKEVGALFSPNLPLRRKSLPLTNSAEPSDPEFTQTSGMGGEKRLRICSPSEDHGVVSVSFTEATLGSQLAVSTEGSSSREFQKRIGRFFYETGIDFDAATSPSFQRMINPNLGSQETACRIPSCEDLRGWILKESVEEMQQYVKEIQSSWASTGCSILLDGWEDSTGRNLLNVLASCPKGTVYIRSADISGFDRETDSLTVFLDDIVKEVGVENIVQIITYSTSAQMENVGKGLMEKYKTLFWTVSASHCLELMLEKVGMMEVVKEILEKAKSITRFVHSHASVLKLWRDQTSIHDLVRPSKFKLTIPFLTLEKMVFEQESLQKMFLSNVWRSSIWASTMEGKKVAELVADNSFWIGVVMVVKATIPLVRAIDLITNNSVPQLGYIYETMDQAKETIRKELKNKKSIYMPFWKEIDEIWNGCLHSPLHATAYFLNPKVFYANQFRADSEVASGLLFWIVRLAEDPGFQDVVSLQIEQYRTAKSTFGVGKAHLQSSSSPASWWLNYGSGYPQLQRLATRILSQTCNGAEKYNLKKTLAEKLLTKGRNPIEQQRMAALVYVHYNLQLQNFNLGIGNGSGDDIDPMDNWLVGTAPVLSQKDELTWKELDCGSATDGRGEGNPGHSNFHTKQEP